MDLSKIGVPFSAWVEKEFPLACANGLWTHGGTSVGILGGKCHMSTKWRSAFHRSTAKSARQQ